jgi:hypothetical protein
MAKAEFIKNFRTARNLFVHGPVRAAYVGGSSQANDKALARTAIWCTPKSVAGFDPNDFRELSDQNRAELQDAVDDFLYAVNKIAPGSFPTAKQLADATPPFEQLTRLLNRYLLHFDEVAAVEKSLGTLPSLPDWIVNWDFEVRPDSDDSPAVYLTFYVDESLAPRKELGKAASQLTSRLSNIFKANGLKHFPYVDFQSVLEHTVG